MASETDRVLNLAISMDTDSLKDLQDLQSSLDIGSIVEARSIDGQTVLTFIASVQASSIPAVVVWVRSNSERKKKLSVIIDGRKMNDYTATEVVKIVEALNAFEEGKASGTSE